MKIDVKRQRLDKFLCVKYPEYTRNRIQELIKQSAVTINGAVCTKPGIVVDVHDVIIVNFDQIPYVSRAGQKLERALDFFNLDVTGLRVLDAGLSTGGFADCLLQHGAAHVYGVDVGTAQVNEELRNHTELTVLENTDVRDITLEHLGSACVDLVTLDLSFISVVKVFTAIVKLLCKNGLLVVLIKPQFEVGKKNISKSGVVRDAALQQKAIDMVSVALEQHGFVVKEAIESPVLGSSGNKEFLLCAHRG